MTRGLVDMKDLFAQMELSFPEIKIDSKWRHGLSHHLKKEFPILPEVALFLAVHRDLNRFILEGLETLKMVRMGMGDDDQIDLFWRNPVSFHLVKEIVDVTGMTGIDENSHLSPDHVGVAIVLIRIKPHVGIEVVFNLHRFLSLIAQ